jgi:hypothetical protein
MTDPASMKALLGAQRSKWVLMTQSIHTQMLLADGAAASRQWNRFGWFR